MVKTLAEFNAISHASAVYTIVAADPSPMKMLSPVFKGFPADAM
jgi:hypothetical protein